MNQKHHRPEVPEPAQTLQRKESLPWQKPKPSEEDPEGPDKLAAILNSPSYVPAIEDVDFLDGADARGVRLQLDYLKPERLLKEQGVEHTIVVFGSTRIIEPAAAATKVEQLRDALSARPEDSEIQQRLLSPNAYWPRATIMIPRVSLPRWLPMPAKALMIRA